MALKSKIIIKRGSSYPCSECRVDIVKGEEYTSVSYSDGFRNKLHGAYHHACWKKSPDNPRNQKTQTPSP